MTVDHNMRRGAAEGPSAETTLSSSSRKSSPNTRKRRVNRLAENDLERIRLLLYEISKIIGPGDDLELHDCKSEDITYLEVNLRDIIRIAPEAFEDAGAYGTKRNTVMCVAVPHLQDQLTSGKVVTTLRRLLTDVPSFHLSLFAMQHGDDVVELPLTIVKDALRNSGVPSCSADGNDRCDITGLAKNGPRQLLVQIVKRVGGKTRK